MDYEKLYNELKEEYEMNKMDTDEIMKEYESTIKLLTDTTEVFKKENEVLKKKNDDLLLKQKQFMKDIESYKTKNLDKMKDIEILNTKNEKLIKEIKTLSQNKALFDSKIVTLENDNDHFLSKIRENESRIEDLNMKLESALEENISLQTDFETYKQMAEEQLLRKEQELKDAQTEILNKDKIVARLTMKETINKIGKQLGYGNGTKMHVPNVLSHLTFHSDISNSTSNLHSNNIISNENISVNSRNVVNVERSSRNNRTWSTRELMNAILNHSQNNLSHNNGNSNSNNYEKERKESFTRKRSVSTKEKNKEYNMKLNQGIITNKEDEDKKKEQLVISEAEADDDDSEGDSLKSVNIHNNEDDDYDNNKYKVFDNIEIECNCIEITYNAIIKEKGTNVNGNNKNTINNKESGMYSKRTDLSDTQLTENLKEMLVRIQKRKSELLTYRKTISEKLDKIGVKIL